MPVAGVAPSAVQLPTLAEVVHIGNAGVDGVGPPGEAERSPPVPALDPVADPDRLAARVLRDLLPRIDALFEARRREALAPALARAADSLIRESRLELSSTLREMVLDAVTRELRQADRRGR